MRKALVVGINEYSSIANLFGCATDARAVAEVLERHYDGSKNFGVRVMIAESAATLIKRTELREQIETLFRDDAEVALLYFAGHGHVEKAGGFICASDCAAGNDGVSLIDVMTWANDSKAKNKIIVLDSCFAGAVGDDPLMPNTAQLSQGLTILTAATKEQYASEKAGRGVFTNLFVDALTGAAANLVGEVTPGSVYAHIDQSLGEWDQRPVFKTNVKSFISLRKTKPALDPAELRRIREFFPSPGVEYKLDPSFEPRRDGGAMENNWPAPIKENNDKFALLQKYNRVNLVVPVDAIHMWNAAVESKSCKLTALGEHYRRLVEDGRL
jgi:alkylated DNA nucleotide flippase Atl1